jgi:cyclase
MKRAGIGPLESGYRGYTVLNMSIQKTTLVRVSGVVLAIAGLCLIWFQQAGLQAQPPKQPLEVQKVTDHLWVIMNNASGNVAVMPTDEGILLVDDKFEQDGPEILAKVKGVSDKPIKYILNTHQHGDHTGGNAFMLKNTPAEIVIHKNARANMVEGKQPGLPQITFADEAQVFVGGREVSAHHVGRGHTNGDAVILFPTERVLHTGDLFVNGGSPFIDYSAKGSIVEWDKTLDRVLQLDFDIVIPGHGPVAKKADLVKWRDSIAELRARTKKACAGGAADAVKRLDLSGLNMDNSLGFLDRSVPAMCAELAN